MRLLRMIITTIFIVVAAVMVDKATADAIPTAAKQHQRLLVRTAHQQLGLAAPIATLAAQVHQESAWSAISTSKVGAQGLAQFMPATAQWMPQIDYSLHPVQPFNPGWALRAMVVYDAWLLNRTPANTQCDNWAFALSAYNGGLGWVQRDRALASSKGLDKRVYFESVEKQNAGRATASKAENTHYVRNILTRWEPLYARAGWGLGICENRWKNHGA